MTMYMIYLNLGILLQLKQSPFPFLIGYLHRSSLALLPYRKFLRQNPTFRAAPVSRAKSQLTSHEVLSVSENVQFHLLRRLYSRCIGSQSNTRLEV